MKKKVGIGIGVLLGLGALLLLTRKAKAAPEPANGEEPPTILAEETVGIVLKNPPAGAEFWGYNIWPTPAKGYGSGYGNNITKTVKLKGFLGKVVILIYHLVNGERAIDLHVNPGVINEYGLYEFDCETQLLYRI